MNPLTPTLTQLAWSQIWQVTALALAVGFLVRLTCRRRPHLAYALWMLVLLKCLTPPLWSSPTGIFSWAQFQRVEQPATTGKLGFAGMPAAPEPFAGPNREETAAATTAPTPPMPTPFKRTPLSRTHGLALAWLTGAALLATWVTTKWFATHCWLARSCTSADPQWQALADDLCRRLDLRRTVRLFTTDASLGPAAFGILRPKILLPAALLDSKPPAQIEPMLAHELMHVRRRDPAVGKLQLLVQILWWFHPLVWWANRELRRHRESACDEEVLARLGCPPALYARTLLDLLAWRRALRPAFAFPGLRPWEVTSKRLEHIMHKSQRFHCHMPRWCWVLLIVAIALVLPGAGFTLEQPTNPPDEELSPAFGNNYLVFPVRTELQFRLVGRDADAFVLVNAGATPLQIDLDSLRRDLSPYTRHEPATVVFRPWFGTERAPSSEAAWKSFRQKLQSLAKGWGLHNIRAAGATYSNDSTWKKLVTTMSRDRVATAGHPENPLGNDAIQVYPVRTTFSRYLTGDSDCDVGILGPFAKDGRPRFEPDVRAAILEYVPKLKLETKRTLRFRIWTDHDVPNDLVSRFLDGEAEELATALGFEHAAVAYGAKPPTPVAKPDETQRPARETNLQQPPAAEATRKPSVVIRKNYVIFAPHTRLHHLLAGNAVYVLINAHAVLQSDAVNLDALDLESLRRDLAPYAGTEQSQVNFHNWVDTDIADFSDETRMSMHRQLRERALGWGFQEVYRGMSASSTNWREMIEWITTKESPKVATAEQPLGDDHIHAYPVNTAFSRYLTGDADCHVDVLTEFAKNGQPVFEPQVRDAVLKYVPKLQLARKDVLSFHLWTVDVPYERGLSTQFTDGQGAQLASVLGFQKATARWADYPAYMAERIRRSQAQRAVAPDRVLNPGPKESAQEDTLRKQWNTLNEAQARAATVRHLHGLARALHDYHRVHNKFPPAVVPNDKLPPEKRLSGLVLLLPHLDVESWNEPGKPCFPEEMARAAKALYKTIDLTKAWDDPANLQAARTVVPAFLAPRGGAFRDDHGFAVSHFAFVCGAKGDDNGVFPGERAIDFEELAGEDGASATLALGQINRRLGPWIAAGTSSARYVYHPLDAGAPAMVATFDSNFEGGCYFAKGDSSTFFILDETEADVLYALTTRAGGELFDDDTVKTRPPPRNPSEPRP